MELTAHNRWTHSNRWLSPTTRIATRLLAIFCTTLATLTVLSSSPICWAQEVGDFPPARAIRAANESETPQNAEEGIKVRGFMFLDKNGNRVWMPGMTYEEFDQLESGSNTAGQVFVFDPLKITGTISGGRAEMELELQVTVEPTGGRLVSIPLQMENFRLLRSPEITSKPAASERDFDAIDAGANGLVLQVRSQRRRKLTARMSFSALVESGPPRLLKFRLPNVSSLVHLEMDDADLTGEIVSRREVPIVAGKTKDGRTEFDFECVGGNFLLQWRANEVGVEAKPLLEVDSFIEMDWDSSQDQPIASVLMNIRNLRERRSAIESFDLVLPKGAVLLDTPMLLDAPNADASGQAVQAIVGDPKNPDRRTITIPVEERANEISLRVDLQLPNDAASSRNPLLLTVPTVPDALRQFGNITVSTGTDHQLRWRASQSVNSSLGDAVGESDSSRTFRFRFSRGNFTLPMWITASKRQLRLTSESLIKVTDTSATLEMNVDFAGQATKSGVLQINMADWQLLSVTDSETEETLPWLAEDNLSIDINSTSEDPSTVRIVAEQRLDNDEARETSADRVAGDEGAFFDLVLPQIVKSDDAVSIGNQFVSLQGSGRSAVNVDLTQSNGIERTTSLATSETTRLGTSRFRITSNDRPANVAGDLKIQPPQITLASDAGIKLLGDVLITTVDWTVTPQVDLVGRLPVRVPGLLDPQLLGDAAAFDFAELARSMATELETFDPAFPIDNSVTDGSSTWSVTVKNVASGDTGVARLVPLSGDRFELRSQWLGKDEVVIRWRQQTETPRTRMATEILSVALPIPAIADVTIRGDFGIALTGDSSTNLLSADSPARDQIQFQSLPDEVRLRLTKRTTSQDDLSIRKAVLRSAIGASTRHEQLLARIQGGDALELGIPAGLKSFSYEAYIDNKQEPVSRVKNKLRLSLPGDQETHLVDLRIWVDEPSHGLLVDIQPILQLPIRAGSVYWQIITPRDGHVVWAAPTIGRAMDWRLNGWRLSRTPIMDDASLIKWASAIDPDTMPPGNRYLYVGSDVRSFHARTMSQASLWFLVGGFVLGLTWLLTYVPVARSPLTAVAAALLFVGLLAIAPDAAVLAGQLTMIALLLVIIMFAIRSVVGTPPQDRILKPTATPQDSPSTQTVDIGQVPADTPAPTQSMPITTPTSEVSSS